MNEVNTEQTTIDAALIRQWAADGRGTGVVRCSKWEVIAEEVGTTLMIFRLLYNAVYVGQVAAVAVIRWARWEEGVYKQYCFSPPAS